MRRITKLAAIAGTTLLGLSVANAASASVQVDPATGAGFVGKGDVQTAFGWSNKTLQDNATSVRFSTEQVTSQVVTQHLLQDGTQAGTQTVRREVSCTIEGKNKSFYNEGTRSGVRSGERDGSRTGSRAGTVSRSIVSAIDADPRKGINQFTGFVLKGFTGTPVVTTTAPAWGDDTFGDWDFQGAYAFDDVEWSGWVSEPGESPAECLSPSKPDITDLVDITTPGAVEDGAITPGDVHDVGAVEGGTITYGPLTLSATAAGVTKAL